MRQFLRSKLYPAILAGFLAGCAGHPPIPDLNPVATSNTETRQSIKATRADIQPAQIKAAAGATALEKANANLSALLSAPVGRASDRLAVLAAQPIPSPTPVPTPTPKPSFFHRIFGPR
jgi:hypothetical protein